jgi:hypothetical protein
LDIDGGLEGSFGLYDDVLQILYFVGIVVVGVLELHFLPIEVHLCLALDLALIVKKGRKRVY